MKKASKAIRRSSIRLKSFSCGHPELNLIVSDMKDMRSAAKHFAEAQETVWKDLHKWASRENNEAIRESFTHLIELNRVWTDVQNDFIEQLNKFKYAFMMILEGEVGIDKLQDHLSSCKMREDKLKKDLQKATRKNNDIEARQIEQRIVENRSSMKTTQQEITERANENEAVKMIRLREGLLKLSSAYVDLGYKSSVIFDGKKCIAATLPQQERINERGMHNVVYRGSEMAKKKVAQVKESVKRYKQASDVQPGAPPSSSTNPDCSPPPPYTHVYPSIYPQPLPQPYYMAQQPYANPHHSWSPSAATAGSAGPVRYDLPPTSDYEQDIAGAIGGVRM